MVISGVTGSIMLWINGSCFVAGTPVELDGAAQRAIEQLRPGDLVSLKVSQRTSHRGSRRMASICDAGDSTRLCRVLSARRSNDFVILNVQDTESDLVTTLKEPRRSIVELAQNSRDYATASVDGRGMNRLDAQRDALQTVGIEAVHAGMKVASRNPFTNKTEFRTVVRTFKHTVHEIVKLEVAVSTGGPTLQVLRGTPQHPFFTSRGLVPMGELRPGMKLLDRNGSTETVNIVTREHHREGIAVYNFEVEGDHTYFIGKTGGGVWVHNECTDDAANEILSCGEGSIIRIWNPYGKFMENGISYSHSVFLGTDGNIIDSWYPEKNGPFDEWAKSWEWGDQYGYEYLDPDDPTASKYVRGLWGSR